MTSGLPGESEKESGHLRRPNRASPTAVVVDSHPIMRSGMVDALTRGGFDVTAHGASLADVRHRIDAPAAILVGWDAVGRRDLEGLRDLVTAEPASKVVVLATAPTPDDANEAFAAGASAFILKTVDPDDLAPLIRQIVEENIIAAPVRDAAVPAAVTRLTPREQQVLARVASGSSNAAVAAQLWLSEPTVKFHLRNIYRKLDVSGRTEASRLARELGLMSRSHAL
jgi:two-component system, NarL family, nitrate/nitrite response regulator NarL